MPKKFDIIFNDASGNEGGDGDDILIFTPDPDAPVNIVTIAAQVLAEMKRRDMDAEIRFPKFWIEVERGTDIESIVDAYDEGIALTGPVTGRKPRTPRPPKR